MKPNKETAKKAVRLYHDLEDIEVMLESAEPMIWIMTPVPNPPGRERKVVLQGAYARHILEMMQAYTRKQLMGLGFEEEDNESEADT